MAANYCDSIQDVLRLRKDDGAGGSELEYASLCWNRRRNRYLTSPAAFSSFYRCIHSISQCFLSSELTDKLGDALTTSPPVTRLMYGDP